MDIWDTNKLFIFLAFVMPGFISIKFYQLLTPGHKPDTTNLLIDAVSYSAINYAILFIPILLTENSNIKAGHPWLYYSLYVIVLFIAPIFWAFIWKKLRTSNNFQKNAPHPIPLPWDFVFSQRKKYWIKAYLKNGSVIGGLYGEKSFSSNAPEPEQLYLQESWIINEAGGLERTKKMTAGVIILSNEISYIELIKYEE
jgi:hypothetical protein